MRLLRPISACTPKTFVSTFLGIWLLGKIFLLNKKLYVLQIVTGPPITSSQQAVAMLILKVYFLLSHNIPKTGVGGVYVGKVLSEISHPLKSNLASANSALAS